MKKIYIVIAWEIDNIRSGDRRNDHRYMKKKPVWGKTNTINVPKMCKSRPSQKPLYKLQKYINISSTKEQKVPLNGPTEHAMSKRHQSFTHRFILTRRCSHKQCRRRSVGREKFRLTPSMYVCVSLSLSRHLTRRFAHWASPADWRR